MSNAQENPPFKMTVRRCLRCGGILTSRDSVRDGYGSSCLQKERMDRLKAQQDKDQISLFAAESLEEDYGQQN